MNEGTSAADSALGRREHAAKSLRLFTVAAATTLVVSLVGFSSSILTIAASERATRARIEASYARVLPGAPALRWVNPLPVKLYRWADNAQFDYPRSRFPLRHWLFTPKYSYVPRNLRQFTGADGQGNASNAYLVTRTPLPFVIRVHYAWLFRRRDREAYKPLGLSSGATERGVATYLAFFGVPVRIDEHPYFAWTG